MIQTSYWSIMMAGRVKLPTTIDRRREEWMAFPGRSPNHCYIMCSSNNYAVLVSQLLVEASPPQLRGWSTRTTESFTFVYTLDLYSWQTNRSNWSYSSCDRSRCPNDSKALSMSSSHAINTLKHHSLDLPANRPDMSDPV